MCVIERERDCDVSMVCALHGSPTICRVNIREGDTSSGQELMPYLQPVPPQVKWLFCRLEQRSFSTAEFMAAHPTLQPFTFSLFQSLWYSSVHTAYMEHLGRAACVCVCDIARV